MLLSHALKHGCVDVFLAVSLLLSQAAQRVGQGPAHMASESTRPPPASMRTQPFKARRGGAALPRSIRNGNATRLCHGLRRQVSLWAYKRTSR